MGMCTADHFDTEYTMKGWGKYGPEQSFKSFKVNGRKRSPADDHI